MKQESENIVNDKRLKNEKIDEINLDLNDKDITTHNKPSHLDLFNAEEPSEDINHQIDLTKIEQENKELDEKVLEIPAFLRRQAN